jgi:hypothetical protein
MSIENEINEENIDSLDQESSSPDPCEEVRKPSDEGNGPGNEPNDGDVSSTIIPPFLAPIENIEQVTNFANREINIIDKSLFFDWAEDQFLQLSENELRDPLRTYFRHHWTYQYFDGGLNEEGDTDYFREYFFSDMINYNTVYNVGNLSFDISEEAFSQTQKYWTAELQMPWLHWKVLQLIIKL